MSGRPPVATITTSGSSASTSSASASWLKRISTPSLSHCAIRQSTMPISSRAAPRPGGEPDLAARLVGRLEQHDLVAALGRDPRRLEAGRAGADHHDSSCCGPSALRDRRAAWSPRGRSRGCGCRAPRGPRRCGRGSRSRRRRAGCRARGRSRPCARCAGRRCAPGSCRPCRACRRRSRGARSRRR